MTAAQNAYSAFGKATPAVKTPRQIEYQAFAMVTRKLSDVETLESFPKLVEALHINTQLWSKFSTDVSQNANGLPDLLRGQIYYLAKFTRDHSQKVMKKEADTAPLIEINTMMMKGLRDSPGST